MTARGPVRALTLLAFLALTPAPVGAEERATSTPALDRVERHAVLVSLRFRRDVDAQAQGVADVDPDSATEVFRRWRMSLRVPGFVASDRRTVLLSDVFVPQGTVRSVEVEGRDGRPVPATIAAFLPRCGAVVLRTEQDLAAEPIAFPASVEVTPETPLWAGSLAEGGRGLECWAEPLGPVRRRAFREDGYAFGRPERVPAGMGGSSVSRTADLVMRADGTPLGFEFGGSLDLVGSVWKGPDVLADLPRAVPISDLRRRAAALTESSYVHQVRLAFRPATTGDVDPAAGPGGGGAGRSSPTPEPDGEARWWGLAVAPDLLVVPSTLAEAWVQRIARVTVEDAGEPVLEASYEGRLRGLGAFAVRLSGATLDPLPAASPAVPAAEQAFLVHRVAWRSGARRDQVDYDRSLGMARGYGDRLYLAAEEAVPAGAFLLDLAGRVLGFTADLRPDDVDVGESAGRQDDDGGRGVTAVLLSEGGGPAGVAKDLDRRCMPVANREARRLPWLGVEYEPLKGAGVAEALDVSGPTHDGTRGLLVNVVYEGSPAARAGLRVDDVLLSARRKGGAGADAPPVDLSDTAGAVDWPDESEVPRPWVPRLNALVRLLDAWGIGSAYDLEVLRGGEVRTVSLAVEAAPRDVSTAVEVRDAETGLAVKELTYEVRHALRLASAAPGVLVSRVEEGSPAFQARILANEVVQEVSGRPVADPDAFARLLADARAAHAPRVRAVVLRLDRTRFVDLRISPPETGAEGR